MEDEKENDTRLVMGFKASRRRQSILKESPGRNTIEERRSIIFKKRVSFSGTNTVKEFKPQRGGNTEWDSSYELPAPHHDSSSSMCTTDRSIRFDGNVIGNEGAPAPPPQVHSTHQKDADEGVADEEDENSCDSTNFLRKFLALTPAEASNPSSVPERGDTATGSNIQSSCIAALQTMPLAQNPQVNQPVQQPAPPLQLSATAQASVDDDDSDTEMQKNILSQFLASSLVTETASQPSTPPTEEDADAATGQSNFLSKLLGLPSVSGSEPVTKPFNGSGITCPVSQTNALLQDSIMEMTCQVTKPTSDIEMTNHVDQYSRKSLGKQDMEMTCTVEQAKKSLGNQDMGMTHHGSQDTRKSLGNQTMEMTCTVDQLISKSKNQEIDMLCPVGQSVKPPKDLNQTMEMTCPVGQATRPNLDQTMEMTCPVGQATRPNLEQTLEMTFPVGQATRPNLEQTMEMTCPVGQATRANLNQTMEMTCSVGQATRPNLDQTMEMTCPVGQATRPNLNQTMEMTCPVGQATRPNLEQTMEMTCPVGQAKRPNLNQTMEMTCTMDQVTRKSLGKQDMEMTCAVSKVTTPSLDQIMGMACPVGQVTRSNLEQTMEMTCTVDQVTRLPKKAEETMGITCPVGQVTKLNLDQTMEMTYPVGQVTRLNTEHTMEMTCPVSQVTIPNSELTMEMTCPVGQVIRPNLEQTMEMTCPVKSNAEQTMEMTCTEDQLTRLPKEAKVTMKMTCPVGQVTRPNLDQTMEMTCPVGQVTRQNLNQTMEMTCSVSQVTRQNLKHSMEMTSPVSQVTKPNLDQSMEMTCPVSQVTRPNLDQSMEMTCPVHQVTRPNTEQTMEMTCPVGQVTRPNLNQTMEMTSTVDLVMRPNIEQTMEMTCPVGQVTRQAKEVDQMMEMTCSVDQVTRQEEKCETVEIACGTGQITRITQEDKTVEMAGTVDQVTSKSKSQKMEMTCPVILVSSPSKEVSQTVEMTCTTEQGARKPSGYQNMEMTCSIGQVTRLNLNQTMEMTCPVDQATKPCTEKSQAHQDAQPTLIMKINKVSVIDSDVMTSPMCQVTRGLALNQSMKRTQNVGYSTSIVEEMSATVDPDIPEKQKTSILGKRSSPSSHTDESSSKLFALSPERCDLELSSSFTSLASPCTPSPSPVESRPPHLVAFELQPSSPLALPLSTALFPLAPQGDVPEQPSHPASSPEQQPSCSTLILPSPTPLSEPIVSLTAGPSSNEPILPSTTHAPSPAPASPPPPQCPGWCSLQAGSLISNPYHSGYKWCIIEADGDKWCLSLVHTTLQVFLTVAHHQRLHLIITNADTNFKNMTKPMAKLVLQVLGCRLDATLTPLTGLMLCEAAPALDRVFEAYHSMHDLMLELQLIKLFHITKITTDSVQVTLSSYRHHTTLEVEVRLEPPSPHPSDPYTLHPSVSLSIGKLRKEAVEAVIADVAPGPQQIQRLVTAVHHLVKSNCAC